MSRFPGDTSIILSFAFIFGASVVVWEIAEWVLKVVGWI